MEHIQNLLHWFFDHWGSITAVVGSVAAMVTWFLARRKEWKEKRRAKTDATVDSQVIHALQDRAKWGGSSRGMTGAGDPLVRSAEIAEAFSLDCDAVSDSLERLEARGRVRNAGGTSDNPAPYWHIVHR